MINLLEGKTARQRSEIKAAEIAKFNFVGTYDSAEYGIRVEIQKVEKIISKGIIGLEILARAWKGDKQLGFGSDGSVEIERFRFYNPPILVADPNGDIIRKDKSGNIKRTLREDPIAAIQSTLAHTIKVVGKVDTQIVKGKIGNTTSTFYPDANPESTSVDGRVSRLPTEESWASIIAGAGTHAADDSDSNDRFAAIGSGSTTDLWNRLERSIFLFDTSSLPDTDDVDSATMSLYGQSKSDALSINPDIDIYTSTPASNTAVVAADYAQVGSTSQTSGPISYANFSTTGYNDFTFSVTGKGNISKTGISKFGARNANYDVASNAPSWSTGAISNLVGFWADAAGTDNDPKLVVVHSVSSSIKTVNGLAKASVKTVNGLAIASVKTWNNLA